MSYQKIKNNSERIFSQDSAYQMTSFLMGVIKRGTAKNINNFNFQIAGKLEQPTRIKMLGLLVIIPKLQLEFLVGFDEPKSLGKFETGSNVAAPIFRDFMNKITAENSKTF